MLIDTIHCCNIFTVHICNVCSSILYKCPSYQSRRRVWNNWNCYVESTLLICNYNCSFQNSGTSWMTFKKHMNNKVLQLISYWWKRYKLTEK
jgi:hypothetical protein